MRYSKCTGYAILISALFLLINPVIAQLNTGGIPRSFSMALVADGVPVMEMTPPDVARLNREDKENPVPFRFAENLQANFTLDDFSMKIVNGATIVRRLTIVAPGAKGITLYFDQFRLPEGAKLFVYNPARTQLLGAFTSLNNNKFSTFATSLITGDQVTVEYNAPAGTAPAELRISEVAYAYRGVGEVDGTLTGFGAAGKCEVNVNCTEGTNWQKQKRGVTRIQIKRGTKNLFCTGSLVNNVLNDGKPYILTADHCGSLSSDLDITQWIFYFGYEATNCPKPSKEPYLRSMTGATRIAHGGASGSNGSDFFLVLLSNSIPDTFNVYYNGWSREIAASPSGVCVHHPEGDIKKVSTYTAPLQQAFWPGDVKLAHWKVTWAATANGHGTTEPGSSGSPIFDSQGRIVGTLTGGDSSCDSAKLLLPDYFGQFSYHWDKNGVDSTEQLKPWLDPLNVNPMSLNGWILSTNDLLGNEKIMITPNPVFETLSINPGIKGINSGRIIITDLSGVVVHQQNFTSREQTGKIPVNVGVLAPGLYLVTLLSGEIRQTGRFIKMKP